MAPKSQQLSASNFDLNANIDDKLKTDNQSPYLSAQQKQQPHSTTNTPATVQYLHPKHHQRLRQGDDDSSHPQAGQRYQANLFSSVLAILANRLFNVINPAIVFLVIATVAVRYPMIQLVMFVVTAVGTSPLYFILITFMERQNNKLVARRPSFSPHRRQPSIVGAIGDLKARGSSS